MMDNDTLEVLERVVAKMKRERYLARREMFGERNDEMRRLRYDENWTLQAIGDKYGITRERVRQICEKEKRE